MSLALRRTGATARADVHAADVAQNACKSVAGRLHCIHASRENR